MIAVNPPLSPPPESSELQAATAPADRAARAIKVVIRLMKRSSSSRRGALAVASLTRVVIALSCELPEHTAASGRWQAGTASSRSPGRTPDPACATHASLTTVPTKSGRVVSGSSSDLTAMRSVSRAVRIARRKSCQPFLDGGGGVFGLFGQLALAAFRHLPAEGESFTEQGWRLEVVDLDGRRIDKLLVSAVA